MKNIVDGILKTVGISILTIIICVNIVGIVICSAIYVDEKAKESKIEPEVKIEIVKPIAKKSYADKVFFQEKELTNGLAIGGSLYRKYYQNGHTITQEEIDFEHSKYQSRRNEINEIAGKFNEDFKFNCSAKIYYYRFKPHISDAEFKCPESIDIDSNDFELRKENVRKIVTQFNKDFYGAYAAIVWFSK